MYDGIYNNNNNNMANNAINQARLILTSWARCKFLHRYLDMKIVSLEKPQPWTPRTSLQRVNSGSDCSGVFSHAEGFVWYHHAHLLHKYNGGNMKF